ncbi:DUF4167 domain-containing protein [Phaeobacter sp. 22II1-1F12B]|uniref:DUF4167 domain-containing protein n=1 Tax=Phaeobacter sp. 22II1-1F12B TaxID=1317111 RepID=UPI000B51F443|nr:DUF4167 domain-containing protein [Phaeobacter sp. 22II1-1F12B]OWU81368.1 hypothetical protein ATO1_05020 [Phaeobacter sp. 22II1-1F12B]
MRSSKSRSRSKSNRNRGSSNGGGNVVNRVFDSSGPEGKVRGTPQQIIDKYNQLARDAQLGNDRVATENFQQHAEHYLRLLSSAQKEMDQRREEQERQNRERQAERDRERQDRGDQDGQKQAPAQNQGQQGNQTRSEDPSQAPQPDVLETAETAESDDDSGLVETPESKPKKPARKPRARKPAADADTPAAHGEAEAPAPRKPRTRSAKPKEAPVSDNGLEDAPKDGNAPEAAE